MVTAAHPALNLLSPAHGTILVLEPDGQVRTAVGRALLAAGYGVAEAASGSEGLRLLYTRRPAAVVANLDMAEHGGLDFVRIVRAATDAPLVAIMGEGTAWRADQVLDTGADYCLDRAFLPEEVVSRVRAVMRRVQPAPADEEDTQVVQTGRLIIDRLRGVVTVGGHPIQLTRTEARLLDALAAQLGRLAPHRYLLSSVWGNEFVDDSQYLRVYIGYLRAKIEANPHQPRYLLNEWGLGYRLVALPPED